jgi:SMI1-KNR4 cell-wall
MRLDEFIAGIEKKQPLTSLEPLIHFETALGATLPDDYRQFLIDCNGGVYRGRHWFFGPTPEGGKTDAGIHHIGGLREEAHLSLIASRDVYQSASHARIPRSLLWIMDDPFGNAICIGLTATYRGLVYFWDHELEPDADDWDGHVESSGNITLLAASFTGFIAALKPRPKLVIH